MKNQEYVYCSKYSVYDTRLSYIFWLYWNENKLLIGNGPYLGLKVYEQFSNHKDIQSVSIGSNNHAAIWNFYEYITMHKTFDSLYQININSTDLLFTKSTFFIKRKKFMNLSIHFVSHIIIGDKIKILKYEINNNKQITQNTKLYLYSNDTILSATQAIIYTSPWGIGFGLNNATQCNLGPDNYFNLLPSDNQGYKCSNNNYKCEGSSNILVDYNAWIMVSNNRKCKNNRV